MLYELIVNFQTKQFFIKLNGEWNKNNKDYLLLYLQFQPRQQKSACNTILMSKRA